MKRARRSPTPKAPRPRHRERTERDLIEAVGAVLATEGVAGVALSTVARRAGVDKALVYRYFGTFDHLIEAYVEHSIHWPSPEEITPDREALLALPFATRFTTVLRRYAHALRARPATLAILGAELGAPSDLGHVIQKALEARRERFGLELLKLAHDAPPGLDVPALVTFAAGAVHYLLIRARAVEHFNGIAIGTSAGWERIEAALDAAIEGAVRSATRA